MKIPDLKPELEPAVATAKSLPPLALLEIYPSSCLRVLLTLFYILFVAVSWILFWPYRDSYGVWMFLPLLTVVLLVSWRRQMHLTGFTQRLWYEQGKWFLESAGVQQPMLLYDEILVWPRMIILGFKMENTTRVLHLVVMRDSVSRSDFRRLSRWLRVCLKPA